MGPRISNKHDFPTHSCKEIDLQSLLLQVTSPYGSVLHRTQNVTGGQFSFTTTQAGSYLACFWLDNHDPHQPGASVNVDWRIGIAAKDWDSIARKERIQASS